MDIAANNFMKINKADERSGSIFEEGDPYEWILYNVDTEKVYYVNNEGYDYPRYMFELEYNLADDILNAV